MCVVLPVYLPNRLNRKQLFTKYNLQGRLQRRYFEHIFTK